MAKIKRRRRPGNAMAKIKRRRRPGNAMAKIKRTKCETMIYKTLHRKLKIEQHETQPHKNTMGEIRYTNKIITRI